LIRRVALIQFDAVPEQVEHNLCRIERLARQAADGGARWIMFHEGTLCDYTPRLSQLAQAVPDGPSCRRLAALAEETGCFISAGLSEKAEGQYFITQAFFGPGKSFYRYRKTWLWRNAEDADYRNEWARYDPGQGPELFEIDGVAATCFICADGEAPRCIDRAAALGPHVAFYPNNRARLPDFPVFGEKARRISAPMLVTNRVGKSWGNDCVGGCAVFSADGEVLAAANREGREEILLHDLAVPDRR